MQKITNRDHMSLKLRELSLKDEQAFMNGLKDWEGESLSWYTFDWKPGVLFSEHLDRLKKNKRGVETPKAHVPSTMLYGFVVGEIVGRVNVRHVLNEELNKRGGHIGYAVSQKHRKKGYALEMVKQSLSICKTLGIERLLVTCARANIPSWKIIESIGGELEAEVYDDIGKEIIRKYWVGL